MKAAKDITAERLRHLVCYDPDTGAFTRPDGVPVGCKIRLGYVMLWLDGRSWYAHRLAWLYMTGHWPKKHIDHINGNPSDNRWANLRDVTVQANAQNRHRVRSDNKTGFMGVTRQGSAKNPFVAKIKGRTGVVYLGSFKTAEEAHEAYLRVKRRIHEGCAL